jgi:hypothetical protein
MPAATSVPGPRSPAYPIVRGPPAQHLQTYPTLGPRCNCPTNTQTHPSLGPHAVSPRPTPTPTLYLKTDLPQHTYPTLGPQCVAPRPTPKLTLYLGCSTSCHDQRSHLPYSSRPTLRRREVPLAWPHAFPPRPSQTYPTLLTCQAKGPKSKPTYPTVVPLREPPARQALGTRRHTHTNTTYRPRRPLLDPR